MTTDDGNRRTGFSTKRFAAAALVGLLGACIIWIATPYSDYVIGNSFISDSYLPAAGFFLPRYLGFRMSYALAMALSLAVGAVAFLLSRSHRAAEPVLNEEQGREARQQSSAPAAGVGRVWLIAFASGLLVLSLEVLWTRMFAQVLSSSVYAFSLMLCLVLLSLCLGALLARALSGRTADPVRTLCWLLAAAGGAVLVSLPLFPVFAAGLRTGVAHGGMLSYVASVLKAGGLTADEARHLIEHPASIQV